MKRLVCLGFGLCLAAGPIVLGQEETQADLTDPIKILKKVDVTAKKVKAVRYHARTEMEGPAASELPTIEADVIFIGKGSSTDKYRIKGKVQVPGSDEWREMTTGYDGKDFYYIDPQRRVAHRDDLPTVVGRLGWRTRNTAIMIEFIHGSPFSDEINAEKAELIGTATVGDEECYHIEVKYRDAGGQVAHWYFSKKDFLPRRVDRLMPASGGGTSCTRLILTNLEVDPQLDDEVFAVVVPEGFTTTSKTMK